MKTKVVKKEYRNMPVSEYYYEVFSSKKRKFFRGDVWISEETFFSSPYRTDEGTEKAAIKYADDMLKPKQPIKYLKMDEVIYEKSN
jgi:hypothetical protein